ncbi:MAG: hypothetical protein NTZ17_03550 [Phycisphaerae bacterium]|nr:hypothetical protein [Phycisphaerae bacterium]
MKKSTTVYTVMAVLALLCLGGSPAFAGWTVVSLHPAGAEGSCANGVSGGQQVGYAWFSGNYHAGLWSGTAASWVDLNPAGANYSKAYGVSGGQIVGWAFQSTYPPYEPEGRAILWNGSDGSWIDLNPALEGENAYYSKAYDASGDQQVGWATFGGHGTAALWSGSAESWVDLNPGGPFMSGGSWASCAYGVSGGQQVGWAETDSGRHAALWSGTAESWADLNPPGATYSNAYGISGGQKVGDAAFEQFGLDNYHAGLWSGTAGSWVDLNPSEATSSSATGVSGGKQVGFATIGSNKHASLWSGTAASWVDLHALLPAGYTESRAYGIDVSAGEIWVAGHADDEAMLWHYTPEPAPVPALVEQIQQILEFTEDSVAEGELEGVGPGKSADNRLRALVNMLEFAGYAIISEDYDMAWDQLTAALAKCDGQSTPPDFVEGDATRGLATMIEELIAELWEMP